jgi:hypothetical protein
MRNVYPVFVLMLFGVLVFPGCDEGIQAPPENSAAGGPRVSGFSGTIRYKNWPPPDSLVDLRLVAFTQFPPTNIVADALTGKAIVYPPIGQSSLPFNVDTVHYFVPAVAGVYPYVVVAQQYGSNVFQDWRAVGQYDLDTNLAVPSAIQVPTDDTLKHVDINVDFSHRPPQPF